MIKAEAVKQRMSEVLNIPIARVQDQAQLVELVADSFMLIDMVIELQNSFPVRLNQEDLVEVKTVGDLLSVILAKAQTN